MRIGINLKAISKLDTKKIVSVADYEKNIKNIKFSSELKNVFDKLKDQKHEMFIFAPTPVDLDYETKLRVKKKIIKKLAKIGIDTKKVALVNEDDMVSAYKRNHIVVGVDKDKENVEKIKEFTDAFTFDDSMDYNYLLNNLTDNIEANQKTILAYDAKPTSLPSKDKLWMKYYRVGDLKWKDEVMSPYDRLISSNADWSDEIAMEYFGTKYTYKNFFELIDKYADNLASHGIKKGMKVPFMFANTPESIIMLYALFKLKATIVPLNPLTKNPKEELFPKLELIEKQNKENGFDTSYFFITDLLHGMMKEGIPDEFKTVPLPATNSMPNVLKILFNKLAKYKMKIKPITYDDKTIDFNEFIKDNVEHYEFDTSFNNDYASVQLYTGGTIKPKGVLLSEGNLDAATGQFFNDIFDFKRGDKIAAFMPLHHSFGLIIGTHVATNLGVNLDLILKINFKKIYKYFTKDKVNIFGGIPEMFAAILDDPKLKKADLSHVKSILSGGSKLDPTLKEKTENFLESHGSDAKVSDGFGLTEVGGGNAYEGIPNYASEYKIVEPGTTNELDYDQIGELCITGPQVMMSYDDEELNNGVLVEHDDGKVWLHTGDLFVQHGDDRKYEYISRLDRMIKINGEQVILPDLEESIKSLKFVEDCVVTKIPDPVRGFATYAYIKLEGNMEMTPEMNEQINNLYKTKFPKYAIPKTTTILSEFPKTSVGKNDIKELERLANESYSNVKTR